MENKEYVEDISFSCDSREANFALAKCHERAKLCVPWLFASRQVSRADELCEPCSIAKSLINDKSLLTNASRDFLFKRLLLLINVVERGIF
jgi:hypothetical protein